MIYRSAHYKYLQIQMFEEKQLPFQQPSEKQIESKQSEPPELIQTSIQCPYRLITPHLLTLSRPQYKRTCGISSLVSIWNYQFSKLGLGNKDPISIEQAMLKLNLIGNGSIQENFRKKFKKTAQLTQKVQNGVQQQQQDLQMINNDKTLHEYIDTVDFGCFTGNETLLTWYRLLCRIYGGSGRSYMFYKTNSPRSQHQSEQSAKKGLVEGLNSKGKLCFIYHAYDHYFCPIGYEYMPANEENDDGNFNSSTINEGGQLYIMVGESSKMFPCIHTFKWTQIQLDLETYWPKYYNIRRRHQGVQVRKVKQGAQPKTSTIDCIMAFEKIRD